MFAGLTVIAQGATWTLYREPHLLLVRFFGELDDEASAAWRTAAQANIDAVGWPRIAFVAPTEGTAATSLGSRMRSAAFLRHTARHVERVVIVSSHTTSFVIKTVLRAAGAANVELVDVAEAPACLARARSHE
jgi:hypothetical protein